MKRWSLPYLFVSSFLLVWAVISLFPLAWMFYTSCCDSDDIIKLPPKLIAGEHTWKNYTNLFENSNLPWWFLNSLIVACAITFAQLLFDSMAGFVFAKRRFPFSRTLFWVILATMMIPSQVITVPLYILLNELGQVKPIIDTLWAVILPGLAGPFGIFFFKQHIASIPGELEEAARIDGCGDFGIYRHVILPLSKPALATIGIFLFTANWNAFLWPLIVLNSADHYTLTVGLSTLKEKFTQDYGLIMAGATISAVPMIIIFFLFQRYFIKGLNAGAVKG